MFGPNLYHKLSWEELLDRGLPSRYISYHEHPDLLSNSAHHHTGGDRPHIHSMRLALNTDPIYPSEED